MMASDKGNWQTLLGYADEVLCANWHPVARMLAEPVVHSPKAELDAGAADDLLARLYRIQHA
ncbi:MAG TPA: hypothetical protein VGO84_15730 [Burkholderiales bacterium]|jgi:hypothetical protein|nr:hypothetical protein [Burkholderiales bacterium]